MTKKEQKPAPGDLTGDGLGDTAGQATGAEMPGGDLPEDAESAAEQAPAEPGSIDEPAKELEKALVQVYDLTERLARVSADYDNYRRRMQREKEEFAVFANQRLLLSLLPVLDNLDRALATPVVEGDAKLRQGVELTARSFRDILTKEGVVAIEAVGQSFDPNLHEAVMTVESQEHDDNTVVAEFQKGYRLGERVIRPSMVQVNKRD